MKRLTLALLLAAAAPAAAQTARIAHASHSGSPETLAADAAADNYGIGPYFFTDSVRLLTDTTALEYGRWRFIENQMQAREKIRKVQFASCRSFGNHRANRTRYLQSLQSAHHPVKLVSDTLPAASRASTTRPVKAKTKRKRQEAALTPLPAAPDGPTVPGSLLVAAGVLLLAGAGWLLAAAPDKRPLAPA